MAWQPPEKKESVQVLSKSKADPLLCGVCGLDLYQPLRQPGPEDWLNGPGEKDRNGQSLAAWRQDSRRPNRDRMIYLLPLGDFAEEVDVAALVACVRAFYYGMQVTCLDVVPTAKLLKKVTQRGSRGFGTQLLTVDIHKLIESLMPTLKGAFVVMGFTMFDLYPREEWNFVYGQARVGKGTGVFSFARYKGCAPKKFLRRCMMVLCHEIGHLFNIRHCIWFQCLMNGSNHDEEADQRPFAICPMDLAKLQESIGRDFNLLAREEELVKLFESVGLDELATWHAQHLEELRKCDELVRPGATARSAAVASPVVAARGPPLVLPKAKGASPRPKSPSPAASPYKASSKAMPVVAQARPASAEPRSASSHSREARRKSSPGAKPALPTLFAAVCQDDVEGARRQLGNSDVNMVCFRTLASGHKDGLYDDLPPSKFAGGTCLHVAAWKGKIQVVRWLLESGARNDVADAYDRKPSDVAATSEIRSAILTYSS